MNLLSLVLKENVCLPTFYSWELVLFKSIILDIYKNLKENLR